MKFLPFYTCHERWEFHVVIKRKVFYLHICSFYAIFYAISISDTCLRSRKSMCIPNFDKISQSTSAEIKLLPVSETDGRHIGILLPVYILTHV